MVLLWQQSDRNRKENARPAYGAASWPEHDSHDAWPERPRCPPHESWLSSAARLLHHRLCQEDSLRCR